MPYALFKNLMHCAFTIALGASLSPTLNAQSLPPSGANTVDCAGCHEAETELWKQSHHAQAMARTGPKVSAEPIPDPTNNTGLGNFDNARASHFDLKGDFRTIDGHPVMSLTRDRSTQHHVVNFSFGVSPLQQYLTETDDGHLQVLPFAWDTRDAAQGGQRWMTLHPDEDIAPKDRLHWLQPLSSWNGMCADCHSTGLKRNYAQGSDSFKTEFSEVNVGCGSCHGGDPHGSNPIAKGSASGFPARFPLTKSVNDKVHPANSKKTLEICAGCHALRAPLVDGIDPTQPFLDQFQPSLLNPQLYFPDGQIREEVYVWGSFLQSRMHEEGVTCGNCHDPHSQKLKARGNALCGQCHLGETFDTPEHHNHPTASTGAECANCHMAARTYMVVDDRRDHSFRIPDPSASRALNTPDPCTGCHKGKTQDWAVATLANWKSAKKPEEVRKHRSLWALNQAGTILSPEQFASLLASQGLPEIQRASAVVQQSVLQGRTTSERLALVLKSDDPLVLLAAVSTASGLPLAERETLLTPLLTHKFRALRVAAANELRDSKADTQIPALKPAVAEADTADQVSSWRGEGAMNRGLHLERSGKIDAAIAAYLHAIKVDPYFEPSYINLTELYRKKGDIRREQLLYTDALRVLPNSAVLNYSYALHLVRRKNLTQAVTHTTRTLAIEPHNADYAILHLLLLESLGKTELGVEWLRAQLQHHRQSPRLLRLGAKHARALGDATAVVLFTQALQALNAKK